jgi:transcriptional regulator with GAF, ATPase, and Fis domain
LKDKSQTAKQETGFANIIGASRKMQQVFSLIKRVCDTDTTVLVQGESGTGKELIAQALHFQGQRKNKPFVPVNCGAIPGELLESELFGHEKGAFTHAIRTRIGRFELADGGTVFLDEIAEMSPMLQVKLLRVLQERQFERVGGVKTIQSDFRVVAATNRDLEKEVEEGRFRQDLFFRLNVIQIDSPPLRERNTDLQLLIEYFLKKFIALKGKERLNITPEIMEKFAGYNWPGNVRELENVIERMVILSVDSKLDMEDIPARIMDSSPMAANMSDEIPESGFSLPAVVAEFEKGLILKALGQSDWVKNRAAKLLNINRTTLLEKMKRGNISKP